MIMMDSNQIVVFITGLLLMTSLCGSQEASCSQEGYSSCVGLEPSFGTGTPENAEQNVEKLCTIDKLMAEACYKAILPVCDEKFTTDINAAMESMEYKCKAENRAVLLKIDGDVTETCLITITADISDCHVADDEKDCEVHEDSFKCKDDIIKTKCAADIAEYYSGYIRIISAHDMISINCADPRSSSNGSASLPTWEAFKIIGLLRIAGLVVSGILACRV